MYWSGEKLHVKAEIRIKPPFWTTSQVLQFTRVENELPLKGWGLRLGEGGRAKHILNKIHIIQISEYLVWPRTSCKQQSQSVLSREGGTRKQKNIEGAAGDESLVLEHLIIVSKFLC